MSEKKTTKKIIATKKIGGFDDLSSELEKKAHKRMQAKKVLYVEIDEEITTIYDRLRHLRIKNIYLVVPKRALLFQSIVNLKILKRKAEDLNKNIHIITNDSNGIHLANKIGVMVYDKLDGHEHPSLVSGKFHDDQSISPLKASINSFEDATPMRRKEKKLTIAEFILNRKRKGLPLFQKKTNPDPKRPSDKKKPEKEKFMLVAPNRQALVGLVVISVAILFIITYIALPGATIFITPKSSILTSTQNVVLADIETNRAELDVKSGQSTPMIPSYEMTKKIQRVLKYQASGQDFKGENATGTITVVNTSNTPWTLKATTRFQNADGLIFRSQELVTVPAARGDTPGTRDVRVTADAFDYYNKAIGDRGNVGPGRFFLPGLSEESQKKLYGENKEAFKGGKTVVTYLISEEDIEGAKAKMTEDLKAAAQPELELLIKQKNTAQQVNLALLTGADAIEMGTPQITIPPNLVGQKIDSFEVQGEITVRGIAYNKDDLLSILKSDLRLKKSPQKSLVYINDNSLSYKITDFDRSAKKIKVTASLQGIEEYQLSPENENGSRFIQQIKQHVVGKDIKDAEEFIQNLDEIDKVKIESSPAWIPTLPGFPDNIKVELRRADI